MRCLPSATSLLFRGRHLTTTFTHSAVLAGPVGPGISHSDWADSKPAVKDNTASPRFGKLLYLALKLQGCPRMADRKTVDS